MDRRIILIVEFAAAAQLGALLREAGMETVEAGMTMPVIARDVLDIPVITLSLPVCAERGDIPHLKAMPPQMFPIKTYRTPRQRFDKVLKIKR